MRTFKDAVIRLSDCRAPLNGMVHEGGGICLFRKSDDLDAIGEAKAVCSHINDRVVNHEDFKSLGLGQSLNFSNVLVKYPNTARFVNMEIVKAVKDYLGKNVKLDHVYLSVFKTKVEKGDSLMNDSGIYHHDSVGHRLKLYIPFNQEGNHSFPTRYITDTHRTRWRTYANSKSVDGKRLGLDRELEERIVDVCADFAVPYLFDTNGIHAGSYIESSENRIVLIFEFSSGKTLVRGQVGSADFFLHEAAVAHLQSFGLLRTKSLKVDQSKNIFLSSGSILRSGQNGFLKL